MVERAARLERDEDEAKEDGGMKKIAGNQERVTTTTGCVLNQQRREGERVWSCTDEAKQMKKKKKSSVNETVRRTGRAYRQGCKLL